MIQEFSAEQFLSKSGAIPPRTLSAEEVRSLFRFFRALNANPDGDKVAWLLREYFQARPTRNNDLQNNLGLTVGISNLINGLHRERNIENLFVSCENIFLDLGDLHLADFAKRFRLLDLDQQAVAVMAITQGQIESKIWLIENLRKILSLENKLIVILGGWTGLLSLLFHWMGGDKVHHVWSIDIDNEVTKISTVLNHFYRLNGRRFFAATADMYELDYSQVKIHPLKKEVPESETPQIVINTSCEHLADISKWYDRIVPGQWVVVQSNNFFTCPTHVNCVENLEQFKLQVPLSEIHFEGALDLPDYRRFMLIGRK